MVEKWKPKFVLISVDGGGIRGLIPGLILEEIERRLKAESEGDQLLNHVDMFAGTSTGGIIAIGLSTGITAEKLVHMYREENEEIFHPWSKYSWVIPDFVGNLWNPIYSSEALEKKLNEQLGPSKTFKDTETHCLVVSCDISNEGQPIGWAFSSIDRPISGQNDEDLAHARTQNEFNSKATLVNAALSSSAAPTYFPAHTFNGKTFVDGGVIANNPSILAQIEAHQVTESHKDILHISLGTGYKKGTNKDASKDSNLNKLLFWAEYLGDVAIDGETRVTHEYMNKLCNTFRDGVKRYYRLAPNFTDLDDFVKKEGLKMKPMPPALSLDDCSNEALAYYEVASKMMIQSQEFEVIYNYIKAHIRGKKE